MAPLHAGVLPATLPLPRPREPGNHQGMRARIRDHANRLHDLRNEEGTVGGIELTCDVPLLQRSGLWRAVALGVILGLLFVGVYASSSLLWIPVGLAVIWVIHALGLSTRRPEFVRAVLAQRRCPVCGYDLESAARDAQGRAVCPECGAAWRLSPANEHAAPD